jgi:hypothetical protein
MEDQTTLNKNPDSTCHSHEDDKSGRCISDKVPCDLSDSFIFSNNYVDIYFDEANLEESIIFIKDGKLYFERTKTEEAIIVFEDFFNKFRNDLL